MSRETWDLIVVGAGPAGSAAALGALHAAPDLRVLLLDRSQFPRDKACGDGIAPHVVDVLAEVGAGDVVEGWEPLRRLSLGRGGSRVSRPMARPVWVVPRTVFDHRLVRHATGAGAELRRHRVRTVGPGPVLDDRYRGAVVVAADGAHSVLRRDVARRGTRRSALALRAYAPTPPDRRGEQRIVYGERRQPSYAWAFDRGDGLSNVGYGELLGAGRPPTRRQMLAELEDLVPGAGGSGTGWRAHHLPLSGWRWHQPDGPVLLAGDAAGLVNPMTGEGIYYAVASGVLAGRAAVEALHRGAPQEAGALHRSAVRRLLGRHLRHTSLAARLSTLPTVVRAGIGASDRDQRVFDDLVEVGLGRGLLTPRLLAGLARGLTSRTDPAAGRTH